jgi:hypothetical protein
VSLVVEAALVILGIGMLLAQRFRPPSRTAVTHAVGDGPYKVIGVGGKRRAGGVTPAPILK